MQMTPTGNPCSVAVKLFASGQGWDDTEHYFPRQNPKYYWVPPQVLHSTDADTDKGVSPPNYKQGAPILPRGVVKAEQSTAFKVPGSRNEHALYLKKIICKGDPIAFLIPQGRTCSNSLRPEERRLPQRGDWDCARMISIKEITQNKESKLRLVCPISISFSESATLYQQIAFRMLLDILSSCREMQWELWQLWDNTH